MDRRNFLNTMIAAGLTAALDPGELLWTPGRKAFSFPSTIGVDLALPDGEYMVVLASISHDGVRGTRFIYKVAAGPYAGRVLDLSRVTATFPAGRSVSLSLRCGCGPSVDPLAVISEGRAQVRTKWQDYYGDTTLKDLSR